LCLARRDVPLAFLKLICPGGGRLEPRATPGLATLAAQLLEFGPQGLPQTEWMRLLDRWCIQVYAGEEPEFWSAGADCLSEDFASARKLLQALLTKPELPRSEWKAVAKENRTQAKMFWAQPINVLRIFASVQALGYGHPMAHPSTERSYARARYADATALLERAFHAGKGVFALCGGDVEPEAAFDALRELLAALPAQGPVIPPEPPVRPAARRLWILEHPKVDQAFFALTRPGVRAGDKDRVALRLANYALGGGGFSSRLMERVRSKMGGTYGISSDLPENRLAYPFGIYSFTQTGNLRAMLDLIQEVLREIATQGFTREEFEAARAYLHGSQPLSLTSPQALVGEVLEGLECGLSPEDLENDWAALLTTSVDAVNAAAQRLLGDRQFHLAVIGPAKELLPQCADFGPAEVRPFSAPPERWPGA
jgi:zinc protease